MSEKSELASYCAYLLSIIDSKEDAGQDRGGSIAREYERVYTQLITLIREGEADEARKSRQQPGGSATP